MVKRLLRSIRQKPKGVRDQIALVIAIAFTGSIFTVWLITAPARFSSDAQQAQTPEGESTGFADIFDGFGDIIDQSRNNSMTGTAIEADAPPEPTLAELLELLQAEQATSEATSTSPTATTSDRQPVAVWNSLPTTTVEREVRIMPVNNQATATATSSPSE